MDAGNGLQQAAVVGLDQPVNLTGGEAAVDLLLGRQGVDDVAERAQPDDQDFSGPGQVRTGSGPA